MNLSRRSILSGLLSLITLPAFGKQKIGDGVALTSIEHPFLVHNSEGWQPYSEPSKEYLALIESMKETIEKTFANVLNEDVIETYEIDEAALEKRKHGRGLRINYER